MPKYTEAFFNITHKPVTIMQIRNEYNLDHTVYERRYKGHIFCPYCKAVPLTVVHTNGLLYYRGHPHEEHGEGCMYTLKEIVIKDVEKIGGDIEKQAVSQLDMLLRSMVDNNQKPDTTKTGNSGQDCRDIPVVHRQQTLQKRLPQCRLELLPELLAANEAPREVNIYYGRVLCEVVGDKTPYKGADVKVLVLTHSHPLRSGILALCNKRWLEVFLRNRVEFTAVFELTLDLLNYGLSPFVQQFQ